MMYAMNEDESTQLTALMVEPGAPDTVGAARWAEIMGPFEYLPGEGDTRLLTSPANTTAVIRLSDDLALVQATSSVTPVVENESFSGAIALAHASGAVYAVGGEVLSASSLLTLPEDLASTVATGVLQGAAGKLAEAGAVLAGGQITRGPAVSLGFALAGTVSPSQVFGVADARVGDVVVLTKGLGTGVVLAARHRGTASEAHVAAAVASMLQLNRYAMHIARSAGAHAMTVVGAYGILGCAVEIAQACGAQVAIRAGDIPLLPGALQYAGVGSDSEAVSRNYEEFSPHAEIEEELPGAIIRLICDPQISGGLLFTLPAVDAAEVIGTLREAGYHAGVVGSVLPGSGAAVDP
jgi:selenide,water dikinase